MHAIRAAAWFGITVGSVVGSAAAWAQAPLAASSYGPGRIICASTTACELGIGTPASLKYNIDPSALPAADKDRLTSQCTANGTPCVATIAGTETEDVVKATSIKFYN
jgi:hypothetical protein